MKEKFKIEKGIPMRKGGRGISNKYPFSDMLIGDSFLLDDNITRRGSTYQTAKRHGIKIAIRKEGEKIRLWRIE